MIVMSSMYLIGRVSATQAPPPAPYQKVDLQVAENATSTFMATARTPNSPVHGFSINMDQYNAMGQLAVSESGISGFRVYFGEDQNHQDIMVVVGVNSMGSDILNSIYTASAASSGLCPTICDAASPLMGN